MISGAFVRRASHGLSGPPPAAQFDLEESEGGTPSPSAERSTRLALHNLSPTLRDVIVLLAASVVTWVVCGGLHSTVPDPALCDAREQGLFERAVVAGQERIEGKIASLLRAQVAPAKSSGGGGAPLSSRGCPAQAYAAIRRKYDAALDVAGNIDKHLPVLFGFASGFENITEIGVSSVHSSWAFARAASDAAVRGVRVRYRASDILRLPEVDELETALAACPGVDFSFVTADDLVIDTWPSNVLFLDT